jgi:hypothetical protein
VSRYASNTDVSSSRSRQEIENTLERYGCSAFMYGWEGTTAIICFQASGRRIKFELPLPARDAPEFTHTSARKTRRSPAQVNAAWEQATRQRWRALSLVIKAKLEAVESGISVFDEEFMAHILLPDGRTVGQFMVPQIEASYSKGGMPKLLPGVA